MGANKSFFKICVQDFLFTLEAFICWHFIIRLIVWKFARIYFIGKVKTARKIITFKAFSN